MFVSLHRLSLVGLMFHSPVDLFDRVGRDRYYRAGILDWIDSLSLQHGARILELGCGPGILALELARRGFRVSALDRSSAMIKRLEATSKAGRLEVETRIGDACATDWPSGAFDAVIGASLLNIVKDPEALTVETVRLLAPGGQASFYFPHLAFNQENVRRYITANDLPASSAAILLTWSGFARKLDASTAHTLLSKADARNIRFREHFDGMTGSITGYSPLLRV